MIRYVLAAVFFVPLASLSAADFLWKGDALSRWDDPASFEPEGLLKPGDVVTIPTNGIATVIDSDAGRVASLGTVYLERFATIELNISSNVSLSASIRQKGETSSYVENAVVLKKGPGRLVLGAPYDVYAYRCSWDVREGEVAMPDGGSSRTYSFVRLDVASGATFDFAGVQGINIGQIFCSGVITNSSEAQSQILIQRQGFNSEISGRIAGNFEFRSTANESLLDLSGTDNAFPLFYTYGTGTALIRRFGLSGETSSIGTNASFEIRQNGGRLVYTGPGGETCDKKLVFLNSDVPAVLDGGANGGMTFTGEFGVSTGQPYQRRFCFDGSNETQECVFAGAFTERERNGTNYSTYIAKRGSGIWHFTDNALRKNRGVVAVENGTLRFDSLAEAEDICSLGLASRLYADFCGLQLDENRMPYAILLGGGATTGTLEYTGTADVNCSTRPIAVNGCGRLRNATDLNFSVRHAFGAEAGTNTLILACESTIADNRLDAVSDGDGALAVEKEGAGTWILGGDQTFSGSIAVKGGTLKLLREATHPTWFKFVIKQNYQDWLVKNAGATKKMSESRVVQIQEIALYDADGIRRNLGLEYVKDVTDITTLSPSQVAYGNGAYTGNGTRDPNNMFDDVFTGNGCQASAVNAGNYMTVANTNTWLEFVFRLPDDTPEIVAYDYANLQCSTDSNSTRQRQPYAYSILGSEDGVNWIECTNVVGAVERDVANVWNSDGSKPVKGEVRKGLGYQLNTHFRDAVSGFSSAIPMVSVAANAVLIADFRDQTRVAIAGLRVDAAGAGTIDGFDFAEEGVLDLVNMRGSDYGVALPGVYRNVGGFANIANWRVFENGVEKAHRVIRIKDGRIFVDRDGLMVIVK